MSPLMEPIGRIEFFQGIDRKLLKKVAESAIVCDYEKGETIVKEGEMGLGMYVILKGRVEVTKDKDGGSIRLAELGPDQFFAEMSLIDEKPRSASITTIEETECLLFTRDSFVTLMGKNPQLAIRMARFLSERLRKSGDMSKAAPVVVTPPAAVSTNGAAGTAALAAAAGPSEPTGNKAVIQQQLLKVFQWLYTAKAFTRFSVALLGCPVEGTAANLIEEIRVGDVKALIVPADSTSDLKIEAYGAGTFNLHIFTPESSVPTRFDPVAIQPGDRFTFSFPAMVLSSPDKPPAGQGKPSSGVEQLC